MATLVPSHPPLPAIERYGLRNDRNFAVLLVSALTLFALFVDGYHPFAEDGGLYAAGIKRLLDPALYPHGANFVLEPMRFSRFAPMVAAIVRMTHLGLPAILLALHLTTIWATLFAAWMLASRCWPARDARVGAIVLLACWLDLPIAGTALLFMDPYLTARSLSTPCMLLALVGALDVTSSEGDDSVRRKGFALWLVSIVLAAAMHPLMAAYALGASLALMCLRSPLRSVRIGATAALCVAALGLAATIQTAAPAESPEYIRVALTRSYWFLTEWRWYELIGLAAPLAILAAIAWSPAGITQSNSAHTASVSRTLAQMSLAVGTTALLVALFFARTESATYLVARMQPLRIFQTVYLVMILVLGAKLGQHLLRRSPWRWAATLAVLGGVMLSAAQAAYPSSSHLEMPWSAWNNTKNPWVQAFEWIRNNTPEDTLFALDADYINAPGEDAQCFRAIAERPALADYSKDGGEASIAPALTIEWSTEQQAQKDLNAEQDSDRVAALQPLGVSWLVLSAGSITALNCPYRNQAVQVCRIP